MDKKYYSKQRYAGESWEFAKVVGGYYVEHRWFKENLETWYCNGGILYYQEITPKQFYQILEEFVEWYNQTEDGSIGVLEVLDLMKSFCPSWKIDLDKFRMLNVADEGFQALEIARTKFDALEIDVEEIEQLKEKLF